MTQYTAVVTNGIESLEVSASASSAEASISVLPSASVSLDVGTNTIIVSVRAENGNVLEYVITVTREAPVNLSGNADLSSLSLSEGTLIPAFAPAAVSYTANVVNSVNIVNVSATVADGQAAVSFDKTMPVSLSEGENTIRITVTAENGTEKVYTLTVTREAAPALSSEKAIDQATGVSFDGLEIQGFFCFPTVGDDDVQLMGYFLPEATDLSSLTATIDHSGASCIRVDETDIGFGDEVELYRVTAQDGTTKTYGIVVDCKGNSLEDNHVYVYMGGNYGQYENAAFDFTLYASGNATAVGSLRLTEIYSDDEPQDNTSGVILSSRPSPGQYELKIEIDIDGNGSYSDDTGDSRVTLPYLIPDTAKDITLASGLVDVPLLMSDSDNKVITYLEFPDPAEYDIIDISPSTPAILNVYEVGPESVPPIQPVETISITSTTDLKLMLPLPVEDNVYLGFLYHDLDGSGTLSSGDTSAEFRYLSGSEEMESLVNSNGIEFLENWLSRNIYEGTQYDAFSDPGLDFNWSYEGVHANSIVSYDDDQAGTGDIYIANIIADSPDPALWGEFNNTTNSHVRYFEIECTSGENGEISDRGTMLGAPADTDFYHIMLLDMDRSESLTDGDKYNVSQAMEPGIIDFAAPMDRSVTDADLTTYTSVGGEGTANGNGNLHH